MGGEGGGSGTQKSLCTKNGRTGCSQLQIQVFPTMVTLVLGRGGGLAQGLGGWLC